MPTPPSDEPLLEFRQVMARLRAECPWKQAQTHRSLARYLLEETHETLEAIDARAERPDDADTAEHLCEELGDLLLQVYFHAAVADEAGDFTIDDVARGIVEKMRRRNPHVFGAASPDGAALDAEAVNDAWQVIKAAEKPRSSLVEGIPPTLPALLYADKVVDRLARAGRPTDPGGPLFLLVPSPLLGPATWQPVASWLRAGGYQAEVVCSGGGVPTPSGVVEAVVSAAAGREVVLVPHSNAGLLAPHLSSLLDVRAVLYVDAALPGPGAETPLAPPPFLDFLRGLADDGGLLPPWTQWWGEDVAHLFPDEAARAAVEREQQRLPLAYFTSTVPVPDDWAARPSAYVAFGHTYASELAFAREQEWPVRTLGGAHLHALHDPAAVGAAVVELAGRLGAITGSDLGERLLALVVEAHDDGLDAEQALRDAVRRRL